MASILTDSFEEISYDSSRNISRNILSKYEKAKIVGLRLEQLARGAPSTINTNGLKTVREIVLAELEQRNIPFMIVRILPSGAKEYWKLEDMIM